MAETLTYDPTPADQQEFTEEEQKSIQVGEELEQQQQELLAGKFKDAAELENAYIELQKKLGSDEESKEEITDSEQVSEESSDANYYLEDGTVNYEEVNSAYGEKLGEVFKQGGVDPWEISKHFHENNGTITDEMKDSLIKSGLSESSVDSYLAGRAAEMGYSSDGAVNDITESDVSSITELVGGKESYQQLMDWGMNNLSEEQIEGFDSIISSGNLQSIQLAVSGLKSQYEEANGYEGRMLTGKAVKTNADVFRSQAEVVRAMNDPRYDSDPAYRQDIFNKLDRSEIKF